MSADPGPSSAQLLSSPSTSPSPPAVNALVACSRAAGGSTPDAAAPMLVAGFEDRFVRFYDAATGHLTHSALAHPAAVSSLSASPDGAELVSGGHDASLLLHQQAHPPLLTVPVICGKTRAADTAADHATAPRPGAGLRTPHVPHWSSGCQPRYGPAQIALPWRALPSTAFAAFSRPSSHLTCARPTATATATAKQSKAKQSTSGTHWQPLKIAPCLPHEESQSQSQSLPRHPRSIAPADSRAPLLEEATTDTSNLIELAGCAFPADRLPPARLPPLHSMAASFLEDLWNSIFTPGATPTLLLATNVSFAALQAVLLALLLATYSIHFVILSVICAGLWWSINWLAAEVAAASREQAELQGEADALQGGGADTSQEGAAAAGVKKESTKTEEGTLPTPQAASLGAAVASKPDSHVTSADSENDSDNAVVVPSIIKTETIPADDRPVPASATGRATPHLALGAGAGTLAGAATGARPGAEAEADELRPRLVSSPSSGTISADSDWEQVDRDKLDKLDK
ncbi:SMK killer toxin resistance protein [Ascosphaera acerosa]|nr:SMK killer toxin resistance protein [Ascosphaera acerosa]